MKNPGQIILGAAVLVVGGVYVVSQAFGPEAAVAAVLFGSHALCVLVGYAMGIGGVRAGMTALNDHARINSRVNLFDKKVEFSFMKTMLGLANQIGAEKGRAHKATYAAKYQGMVANQRAQAPVENEEMVIDPYQNYNRGDYSDDEW